MHRFVWDLHYPPWIMEHEYPISAIYRDTPRYPLGPSVLPGRYTANLTVNGKTYAKDFTIKMDPRVSAGEAGLRQQFELESKIAEAMQRNYYALQQVRSVRQQLDTLRTHAGTAQPLPEIAALDQKAEELQGDEDTGVFLTTTAGKSLARLNSGLNTLLGAVDSADAAPTTQEQLTFADVNKALEQQLDHWKQIQTVDVPALNSKLKQAGLPAVNAESAVVLNDTMGTSTGGAGRKNRN